MNLISSWHLLSKQINGIFCGISSSWVAQPITIFNGPPPPINVLTKQYKYTNGFGKRLVYCKSTIIPVYPLDPDYAVLRNSSPQDYICLEGDGLLGVTLKLQISDRKSLGVKTKGRPLTTLYKVKCLNFKEALNGCLAGAFKSNLDNSVLLEAHDVKQKLNGYFNGILLSIEVTSAEMGSSFTTNGDLYMRYVAYKFYAAYIDFLTQAGPTHPLYNDLYAVIGGQPPAQPAQGSQPQTALVLASQSAVLTSRVVYNPLDFSKGTRLYCCLHIKKLYGTTAGGVGVTAVNAAEEKSKKGRSLLKAAVPAMQLSQLLW